MNNFLEVSHLSKSFPNFQLRDISISLPKGYIMGLIGQMGPEKQPPLSAKLPRFASLTRDDKRIHFLIFPNLDWH